jgi:hypothetical protein
MAHDRADCGLIDFALFLAAGVLGSFAIACIV